MMKLPETPAGMIKYTIWYDVHSAAVRGMQQIPEGFITTQKRVDLEIIICMVTMVGGGCVNGVKVDGVNPQVDQVIQFFNDTVKIAAFKTIWVGRSVPRLQFQPFALTRSLFAKRSGKIW